MKMKDILPSDEDLAKTEEQFGSVYRERLNAGVPGYDEKGKPLSKTARAKIHKEAQPE